MRGGSGTDAITDFGWGDRIRLEGTSGPTWYGGSHNKPTSLFWGGCQITLNDGRKVELEGVSASQLTGSAGGGTGSGPCKRRPEPLNTL